MTLEEPKQRNQERVDNFKVYYNDEEMKSVTIVSEELSKDDNSPIRVTIRYPDTFDYGDPFVEKNNITQMKISETQHFIEIAILNDKNEMINLEKIPYVCIYNITMASKKVIALSIGDTSESEITGLK